MCASFPNMWFIKRLHPHASKKYSKKTQGVAKRHSYEGVTQKVGNHWLTHWSSGEGCHKAVWRHRSITAITPPESSINAHLMVNRSDETHVTTCNSLNCVIWPQ